MTLEGQPWFVAKDAVLCLGLKDRASGAYLGHLHDGEKRVNRIDGMRGSAPILISESGLYKLIMRSDKPQAKAFQDWVTKEVLPSIRKTGSYVTGQPSLVENPKMSALEVMMALIPERKDKAIPAQIPHTVSSSSRRDKLERTRPAIIAVEDPAPLPPRHIDEIPLAGSTLGGDNSQVPAPVQVACSGTAEGLH